MTALYTPAGMRAPRLAGPLLRMLAEALENPVSGPPLAARLMQDAGISRIYQPAEDVPPGQHPVFEACGGAPTGPAMPAPEALARLPQAPRGFGFTTVADFETAYREGLTDPEAVAERVLAAIAQDEAADRPLRAFIAQRPDDLRSQAAASAARWRAGRQLGPLDGVPVAIKDEVDLAGYPTWVGTSFLGTHPASRDAEVVARLRAAGALLLGKANMHEIGLGVTGFNPHHGTARNPYDPGRYPGGSSSGSAVATAAGYCPLALGADGGGSIRIPAALCGLVGLKPTFGRLSVRGAATLCWSVDALGPIAATARDAALAYAIMAGPDPADPDSRLQPAPHLAGLDQGDLKGLRLGVFRPWFEDADPEVVSRCSSLLSALAEAGAEIVEITLPDLGLVGPTHSVTIVTEMLTAHLSHYEKRRRDYGLDVRVNLALARQMRGYDYVQAQRHRMRIYRHFAASLSGVDAILTPATGIAAPPIAPDALPDGESDLEKLDAIMRFARAANLTGLPAISMPAGYTGDGLPVGLQAMGRPWEEHVLLRIARVAE
ncbi:MAG: amidase, partial [Candidatus Sericytochromatia bacterium]